MLGDIIRLMLEAVLFYAMISWVMAFIVLIAHRAATPGKTLRQLAGQAALTAVTHPLDLVHAVYHLTLRVIASFRK